MKPDIYAPHLGLISTMPASLSTRFYLSLPVLMYYRRCKTHTPGHSRKTALLSIWRILDAIVVLAVKTIVYLGDYGNPGGKVRTDHTHENHVHSTSEN